MDSFYKKYALVATTYCLIRKPIVLSKYKIETRESEYGNKRYRNLLHTEKLGLTLLDGVLMGQIIAPLHLIQDMKNMEINLREMQNDVYKDNDFKKRYFDDLLFI